MRRYLPLLIAVLAAVATPLATSVGSNLEYEFALAASWAVLLYLGIIALLRPKSWLGGDPNGRFLVSIPSAVLWTFVAAPAIGAAAALPMFFLGHCPCSRTGYGFWMLVLFFPAVIFAHAVHDAICRARLLGVTRRYSALALLIFLIGSIGLAAAKIWLNPQKRLSGLVVGFLHGPIYDDWIGIDAGILLTRGAEAAFAAALTLLLWWRGWREQKVLPAAAAAFLAGSLALGLAADRLPSAATGKAKLDQLLPEHLEGDGFTMRFRPDAALRTAADGSAQDPPLAIKRLFRDAQFHVGELKSILQKSELPHVDIYVYPSDDQKKLWFGGGSTDVTDVYTPSVHISLGSWPHPTLRHELVHALSSGFAFHGLGFHPNMAFTEGLAVALAPSATTLTLDDGTASLLASKRLPPIETLFSPRFWEVSGSRAYTAAGSLIQWLIAHRGIGGVEALYAGKSWSDALKEDRDATLATWEKDITEHYDAKKNAIFTDALFRYPGVLDDECPHSKADLARDRDDVYVRMRQPLGWDPDRDYLRWLAKIDPHDEETRVKQWRRDLRQAALDHVPQAGRLGTWRETFARAKKFPPVALEDVELGIMESDTARLAGDQKASLAILESLKTAEKEHFFGDSLTREIEARIGIERLVFDQERALPWRRYLAGWEKKPPERLAASEAWLTTYLRLRGGQFDDDGKKTLPPLLDVEPDRSLSPTFAFEWYKLIGHKLMREEDYANAARAYWAAAKVASGGSVKLFEEHARRANFYAQKGPLK